MTTKKVSGYHGDEKFRKKFLKEIALHQKQDRLVHGDYGFMSQGPSFRGCAVGCSIRSLNRVKLHDYSTDDHGALANGLGIPVELAHLEDIIFENVSRARAKRWPVEFSTAIKCGADLSLVWPQLVLWMLVDEKSGLLQYARTDKDKDTVQRVARLWRRVLAGNRVTTGTWGVANRVALSEAGARTYDDAVAVRGAAAASESGCYLVDYYAGHRSGSVESRNFGKVADKLLALMEAAPCITLNS